MASIDSVTVEVTDTTTARRFYNTAFGLGPELQLQASDAPTGGFRGFTVSLLVAQPADVSALVDSAISAGAQVLKPVKKSFWGFGGVVQAPDGAIWKVATSNKKDKGPASRAIEKLVLLLGAQDVKASKRFYVERGLEVGKSFGGKYVEFDMPAGSVGLALYGHAALAKDAGVDPAGSGSHRLVIGGDAGTFTDPDGFAWAPAAVERAGAAAAAAA
jgi:predicted lactoylglutathione lyase